MVVPTTITSASPSDDQSYVRPLPYLVPRSVLQKAAHFSESYWKLGPDSIVYKILDALCGDAGAGNNKKALFISRLQHSLDSTYFQDLDSFYFGVLGFPRNISESYTYNPYHNALTKNQWIEVLVKDAAYRSRCIDLMSALDNGTSPFGIRMGCKAVLGVDCDVFEIWKYLDSPNYQGNATYNVGRTGFSLRTEVLVTPHRTITQQEKRNLLQVLNRIKPREAILTIGAGLQVNTALTINRVSADGSYFETNITVTGASGISNAARVNYYSQVTSSDPAPDPTIYYFADGVQTAVQTLAFTTGQESFESYDFSAENISTIDSIEYDSATDPNNPATRIVEGKHLVQNAYDIRFGPWTNFDLADSPDNYPGGKYGQHPQTAPALNQDGTTYQFRWTNQSAYVTAQTAIIVSQGGEATATQYHLRLAPASVTTTLSDPFGSLSQNVGVSVLSSWYESR